MINSLLSISVRCVQAQEAISVSHVSEFNKNKGYMDMRLMMIIGIACNIPAEQDSSRLEFG
ncbi:hypothetical protein LINPERPRIM_LOCUS14454 [Linum perenne]